jgi:NCS1 family nucleobase:cation symporter-1
MLTFLVVGAAEVPIGATRVYNLNFFVGFIVSSLIYAGLCHFHPIPGMVKQGWHENKAYEPEDEFVTTPEMVYVGDDEIKDKGLQA